MPGDWFDQNQAVWQQPQGQAGAGMEQGANQAAGYDVAKWNALSPDQQAAYQQQGGAPQATAAPTWMPGAKAGQQVVLSGFDPNKSSRGVPGSKYNAASDAFRESIRQDTGWTRGTANQNSLDFLKSKGFNAKMVGDDKVDFGDGNGPMDIFRGSDGALVFQGSGGGGGAPAGSLGAMSAPVQPMNSRALAPNPYMMPPDPIGVDIGTQPAPTLDQFSDALRQTAPRTVQGPQAPALRIPGFADGVMNFDGGPAVVGEHGPELLNLPKGSDVVPNNIAFGNGGSLPGLGGAAGQATLGGGGGMPTPVDGPIAFGAGGGLPSIGQPTGGAIAFGNGGGMPAIGGQAQQPGPQTQQGGYQYTPMAAPQAYNPQTLGGPDKLALGSITQPGTVTAGQVGPGQPVQAGTVQPGQSVQSQAITAQGVQAPGQVAADRIQGPQALQAQQLGDPGAFHNLTQSEFKADPSYQFDVNEQLSALQNSAAARGMLHHPNTLRGLQETSSSLANRQYDAVNARNLAVQQQNFGNQATVAGTNNAANAQAYGLTNQYQQQAALANQSTGLQAALANQSAGLQAGMFNASQGQTAQQFNAANNQQAQQFNSGQQQQANLANVGNQLQAGQFNSQQGQQAALANQSANLNAGQFNANQNFQTQQANLQNQLAAYNAYQPLAQQNQQFNAAQSAAANQNNFANSFSVNQANNAGSLGAFNANLNAELGRGGLAQQAAASQGQLALGNRSADQSYDLGLRANALGNRQADQSYGLGLGNLGVSQGNLALNQQGQQYNQDANTFNTNYGVYRDNRDTAFNQDLARTQIGAGAATNYGNQAGALYSGQGNANAGAAIGQGNAWGGALGTIGNIAGQAGAYYASGAR